MRTTFRLSFRSLMVISLSVMSACIMKGQSVYTGIEELAGIDFAPLRGKRVGLVTNPTGVDRNLRSTVDILFKAPGVKLVSLFGPEHGVRGDFTAGEYVMTETDPVTKLPVYSLYGKTRKPSKEMLQGIDVLVYDIQDIGSRSYTFISTLGLVMEAAAENGIKVIVLDRPNPLGGVRMEGAITKPGFISFVSQFEIPYLHGLTVGELALFLNGERLLANGIQCDLQVIPMKGWRRSMYFESTGLPWVPSSPHVPHADSPLFYPATGIVGELYTASIGVGYTLPFQLFAAEWIDADTLAGSMNGLHIPGVIFRPVHYKPYYSTSVGKMVHGVQIHFTDIEKVPLSLLQFYLMQEAHRLWPDKNLFEMCEPSRLSMFDKVCGTDLIRKEFTKEFRVSAIEGLWTREIPAFRKKA